MAGSGPAMGMITPSKESVVKKLRGADMLPAIWFIFSRATCDQAVLQMHKAGVTLVTADERVAIMNEVNKLRWGTPPWKWGRRCSIKPTKSMCCQVDHA